MNNLQERYFDNALSCLEETEPNTIVLASLWGNDIQNFQTYFKGDIWVISFLLGQLIGSFLKKTNWKKEDKEAFLGLIKFGIKEGEQKQK